MLKKPIIAVLLFLLLTVCAYAQPAIPRDIYKLRKQLAQSKADTGRVSILISISRYFANRVNSKPVQADSALVAATRANQLSGKLSYPRGLGLSYQAMAIAWSKKKDFAKCDVLIKKAIPIFLVSNLYEDAAEAYLNMEEIYLATGKDDFKVRIGYYEQALPLFLKAGAHLRAAATLNNLGDFYLQIEDYQRSIDYLTQALTQYKLGGYAAVQNTYNLIGNNYMYLDKQQEALKYQLLAVKTAEAVADTTMDICAIYNHAGMVYYASGQFEPSRNYFAKALQVAEKYHDPVAVDLSYNLANNYNALDKPSNAIPLLKKAEKEYKEVNPNQRVLLDVVYLSSYTRLKKYANGAFYYKRLLKNYAAADITVPAQSKALKAILQYLMAIDKYNEAAALLPAYKLVVEKAPLKVRVSQGIYIFSYRIDSARHNYLSALQNYQSYATLRDSLLKSTINKQMQELQVRYETEKKERELVVLKRDALAQNNRVKDADNLRNLTLFAAAALLVLTGVLYHSYRIKQKSALAISTKNIELNKLVTEKEWLLKEIHHRVKNNLQIVMGLLQQQSAYIDNNHALAAIQNSENRMRAIALIHQKLYQSDNLDLIFMPEYIDELVSYLKDSCGLDSRIFFEKQIDDLYLDVAQAVPLGLILNEAITNAIKYAYPRDASGIIYISMVEGRDCLVELVIGDDGPGLPAGFDPAKSGSLGVNLMKGLSKQLGGTFEIANEQGCMITVCFRTEMFKRGIAEAQITLT
jgi:two-component sensor histidine kinase/tetratricopeptide (TPR) repeat protein